MRTLTIALLAFCSAAFAQLDSGSLTVAATRSIILQPDQAVITVSVLSDLDSSLQEILGTVAGAGITEADFAGASLMNQPAGLSLRWDFNLAVPIESVPDTISSLSGLGLTYTLRGTTVSPEKTASAQCPRADLIADATAQARKMALAAAVILGPILSVADGRAIGGAVQAVLVPTAASRTGDFSQSVIGDAVIGVLPLPPLRPVQPLVCSLVVKFGMGR